MEPYSLRRVGEGTVENRGHERSTEAPPHRLRKQRKKSNLDLRWLGSVQFRHSDLAISGFSDAQLRGWRIQARRQLLVAHLQAAEPEPLRARPAVDGTVPVEIWILYLPESNFARGSSGRRWALRHLQIGDDRCDLTGSEVGVAVRNHWVVRRWSFRVVVRESTVRSHCQML